MCTPLAENAYRVETSARREEAFRPDARRRHLHTERITIDMAIAEKTEQPELKRVLGPKLLLLFVVGDILGTGIYALTGQVAAEVGGAAWVPFIVAFAVAAVTACSYLELVTKYQIGR